MRSYQITIALFLAAAALAGLNACSGGFSAPVDDGSVMADGSAVLGTEGSTSFGGNSVSSGGSVDGHALNLQMNGFTVSSDMSMMSISLNVNGSSAIVHATGIQPWVPSASVAGFNLYAAMTCIDMTCKKQILSLEVHPSGSNVGRQIAVLHSSADSKVLNVMEMNGTSQNFYSLAQLISKF